MLFSLFYRREKLGTGQLSPLATVRWLRRCNSDNTDPRCFLHTRLFACVSYLRTCLRWEVGSGCYGDPRACKASGSSPGITINPAVEKSCYQPRITRRHTQTECRLLVYHFDQRLIPWGYWELLSVCYFMVIKNLWVSQWLTILSPIGISEIVHTETSKGDQNHALAYIIDLQ